METIETNFESWERLCGERERERERKKREKSLGKVGNRDKGDFFLVAF